MKNKINLKRKGNFAYGAAGGAKTVKMMVMLATSLLLTCCGSRRTVGNDYGYIDSQSPEYELTDDCALLHIYRPASMAGMEVSYHIHLDDEPLFRVKNKTKKTVEVTTEGLVALWGRIESETELLLDIELGNEYYIRCGVGMGAFVGRPKIELVDARTGKTEFDKIPPTREGTTARRDEPRRTQERTVREENPQPRERRTQQTGFSTRNRQIQQSDDDEQSDMPTQRRRTQQPDRSMYESASMDRRENGRMAEKGTVTLSSSFWGSATGFALNIVPETEKQTASTQASLGGDVGYYIVRNLALKAGVYVSSSKYGKSDPSTTTTVALGAKYHFVRGFYGELSCYNTKSGKSDPVTYGQMNLGYDIYLNDHFYLEPAGYCRVGLNDSSLKFGLLFGFGVAF
ncbi:MAG: hypothetical protein LBS79_06125 [Tannerella sp.]|jgi:hypothetical protein|nr:hypothetical protein [Tannerella sp.]